MPGPLGLRELPEPPEMPGPPKVSEMPESPETLEPVDEPCELLAWDSEHFGRRIGRVRGGRLTPALVARIDRWAAHHEIECLYLLADPGDRDTPPLAAASGFRLVDVRITLERRGGTAGEGDDFQEIVPAAAGAGGSSAGGKDSGRGAGPRPAPAIRLATAADLPALRRLAAVSHHDSRFYFDPHFDRARCDALYAAWIEKSCRDLHGVVLVAETSSTGSAPGRARPADPPESARSTGLPDTASSALAPDTASAAQVPDTAGFAGAPDLAGSAGSPGATAPGEGPADSMIAGYVTAAVEPDGAGRIGLLAVAAAAQGQGTGGRLVAAACGWLAARGAAPVRVVTQGRNLRAQRLYQRFGLRTGAVELWYHRWSGGTARRPAVPGWE